MKTVQSRGRYYTKSKWSTIESAHVATSFGALGTWATDDVVFAKGCGQLAKRHTQMRSRFPPAKDKDVRGSTGLTLTTLAVCTEPRPYVFWKYEISAIQLSPSAV